MNYIISPVTQPAERFPALTSHRFVLADTALDFYIWGHVYGMLYAEQAPKLHVLEQRRHDAIHAFRKEPGIFERVRQSIFRRRN